MAATTGDKVLNRMRMSLLTRAEKRVVLRMIPSVRVKVPTIGSPQREILNPKRLVSEAWALRTTTNWEG